MEQATARTVMLRCGGYASLLSHSLPFLMTPVRGEAAMASVPVAGSSSGYVVAGVFRT